MTIIASLLAAISASGRSVESIADEAGVDKGTLYRILRGDTDPQLGTLEAAVRPIGYRVTLTRDAPPDEAQRLRAAAAALGLTDQDLVELAMARARRAGEPEEGLPSRIAALIGRDRAAVSRVRDGAALSPEARTALLQHLADPAARPLPPPARMGRPRKVIAAR